jgi:hypothetical protein
MNYSEIVKQNKILIFWFTFFCLLQAKKAELVIVYFIYL